MLTSERSQRLEADGFFVWPGMVPADVVGAYLRAHAEWLGPRGHRSPEERAELPKADQIAELIEDFAWHESDPAALELFYRPELIDFLRAHFASEPVMRAPLTGERQRGTSIHADGFAQPVEPLGSELRVWIALEDIDPASGPVFMIPGSHRLVHRVRDRIRGGDREVLARAREAHARRQAADETPTALLEFGRLMELAWTSEITDLRLPRVVPTLLTGDALVFRTDLAHGTMPCADPTLTRRYALAFFSARSAERYEWGAWFANASGPGTGPPREQWTIAHNERGLYATGWLKT